MSVRTGIFVARGDSPGRCGIPLPQPSPAMKSYAGEGWVGVSICQPRTVVPGYKYVAPNGAKNA